MIFSKNSGRVSCSASGARFPGLSFHPKGETALATKQRTLRCRTLALLCITSLLFGLFTQSVFAQGTSSSGTETPRERYNRLQRELQGISEQLDEYKGNRAAAVAEREARLREQEILTELIELKKQDIAQAEADLALKQEEVAATRASILENDALFQQRIVAIYRANNGSALGAVLTVDSFSELIVAADALQRVSKHDTELLKNLHELKTQLEAQQAEIDSLLSQLQAEYQELQANADALAANIAALDGQISAADAAIQAQQAAYGATAEELAAAQAAMDAYYSNAGGSTAGDNSEYVGGDLRWPVPGYTYIGCYFGQPDPNGTPHRGLDISSGNGKIINGATIIACGAGTVINAEFHSSYGNFIVIDHGQGIKTLYAHCASLSVGVGASVSQGQSIGTVGSTGFVTAPHLHLEVSLNNVRQNPLNYLTTIG